MTWTESCTSFRSSVEREVDDVSTLANRLQGYIEQYLPICHGVRGGLDSLVLRLLIESFRTIAASCEFIIESLGCVHDAMLGSVD